MKKTEEFLGLPIISISEGIEIGHVKDIVINADKCRIEYFIVDSGIHILNARVISTDKILGIGKNAVTVESESDICDISKATAVIELLQKDIRIKGNNVLTKKGRLVGKTGDIIIDDDDNCTIVGLEFRIDSNLESNKIIPKDCFITLGKNLIIVTDDVLEKLLDDMSEISNNSGISNTGYTLKIVEYENEAETVKNEPENIQSIDTFNSNEVESQPVNSLDSLVFEEAAPVEEDSFKLDSIEEDSVKLDSVEEESVKLDSIEEEPIKLDSTEEEAVKLDSSEEEPIKLDSTQEEPVKLDSTEEEPIKIELTTEEKPALTSPKESTVANLFEQRQREYLKGRKSTKTVTNSAGETIIDAGQIITEEVIDIAKLNGKLIELVMNNKA